MVRLSGGIGCVVVDSNALLMPFQFKIDIQSEIERLVGKVEIVVPSCVLEELSSMNLSEAKGALKYAERFVIVKSKERGDRGVVEVAKERKGAVVTNDQELIKILRKLSIPVIRMRERQKLDFA
ncbi:MAG: twitching motility protein PilT [Thermoplasmata archaeon]